MRLLTVCHAYYAQEQVIRIISARKATKTEQQQYIQYDMYEILTKVIKALQQIQLSGLSFDEFIASVHTFSDDLQEAYLLAKAAGMSWASESEVMQMQHKKVGSGYLVNDELFSCIKHDNPECWINDYHHDSVSVPQMRQSQYCQKRA